MAHIQAVNYRYMNKHKRDLAAGEAPRALAKGNKLCNGHRHGFYPEGPRPITPGCVKCEEKLAALKKPDDT